jgi:hypothetical protein
MADSNVPLPLLMAHIEAIIRSIARLHAEHHQNAGEFIALRLPYIAFLGRFPNKSRASHGNLARIQSIRASPGKMNLTFEKSRDLTFVAH